jgi:hypothetical protein
VVSSNGAYIRTRFRENRSAGRGIGYGKIRRENDRRSYHLFIRVYFLFGKKLRLETKKLQERGKNYY